MPARTKPDPMDDLVKTAAGDGDQPSEPLLSAAERVFADDLTKRPVIAKLARIMADLPPLQPEGLNKFHGYNFIKDTQVSGALRQRLAAEHVMIIPDVESEEWVETRTQKGGISWVTKMKINFTAIDADSGDEVSGHGFGYGDDAGDKGANKAFTAALKYWLMKTFQIGGEDAESDESADRRAGDRQGMQMPGVEVAGAQITGVQRGGRSDKVTGTQNRQIAALIKEMEMTPEAVVDFLKANGFEITSPDEGDSGPVINRFMLAQTADDAGKLISLLVSERDRRAAGVSDEDDGIPEEGLLPGEGEPDDMGAQ